MWCVGRFMPVSLVLVLFVVAQHGCHCYHENNTDCPEQYGCQCEQNGADYVVACRKLAAEDFQMVLGLIPSNVTNLTLSGDLAAISKLSEPFRNFSALTELNLKEASLVSLIFPRKMFIGLHNVKVLSLCNNNFGWTGRGLREGVFEPLTSLIVLELRNIRIMQLLEEPFQGLRNCKLEILDLSNNDISKIKSDAFSALTTLKLMNLSHNQINNPLKDVFKSCTNLETLDLGDNYIRKLENGTFAALESLKVLKLNKNHLGYFNVTQDAFRGLKKLSHLDLSENKGVEWQQDALIHLGSLKTLLLKKVMSTQRVFPPTFLNHLTSLRSLDLSLNDIECVTAECIDWTAVSKTLEELDLSDNYLGPLKPKMFRSLPQLRSLFIRDNQWQGYPAGTFDGLDELEELDLGRNRFKTMTPLTESTIPNLKLFSCVDCNIAQLAPNALKGLPKLQTLNVTDNDFQKITPDALSDVMTANIVVYHNPWTCNCDNLYETKEWIRKNNVQMDIVCTSPPATARKSLKEVNLNCTPPLIQTHGDQEVAFGGHLTLTCNTSGDPTPIVTFFMPSGAPILQGDRSLFSDGNQTLVFEYIFPNEAGMFTCRAVNALSTANATIEVKVKKDPVCPVPSQCACNIEKQTVECAGLLSVLTEATFLAIPSDTQVVFIKGDVRKIRTSYFSRLPKITEIILSESNISTIEGGAFAWCSQLKDVDLQMNRMQSLPDGCFQGLEQLQSINLRNNLIGTEKLGRRLFVGCEGLEKLDLSFNEIAELPDDIFRGLSNLNYLDLQMNNLGHISQDEFHDLVNLVSLELANNPNIAVTNAFRYLGKLERLNMKNVTSHPDALKSMSLQGLQSLKELDLSDNNLSCIKCLDLSPVSQSLETLILNNNNMIVLAADSFNINALKYLHARNSNIIEIQDGAFHGLNSLIELDLAGNNMKTVGKDSFKYLGYIRTLHINASRIQRISPLTFDDLTRVTFLDMRNNDLVVLPQELFISLPPGGVVKMGGNPWMCNCSMFESKQWLLATKSSANELVCQRPEGVANVSLIQVPDNNLQGCTRPSISITSVNLIIDKHIGEDFTVKCEAVGIPRPIITYEVGNGNPLPKNQTTYGARNSSLTVHGLKLENAGTFACLAGNFLGTERVVFYVTVSLDRVHLNTASWVGIGCAVAACLGVLVAGTVIGVIKFRKTRAPVSRYNIMMDNQEVTIFQRSRDESDVD